MLGFSSQSWASSLPLNWHFNNENFVNNVNKLNSPIPAVSLSAFCFAFAHALAESSQFYLQSAAAVLGEVDAATTARRQSQAVDNLVVTLDAIGDIGRHSPQSKSHA
jgi:energy-converting hydrogenase Eha subunit E